MRCTPPGLTLTTAALTTAAIAALAALTACGSSGGGSAAASGTTSSSTSSSSSSAQASGACALLTTDEVTKAVGASFDDGTVESNQDTPYGKYTVCVWTEKGHALNAVRVGTWEKSGAYDSAKDFDKDAKESSGIGEKSFVASFASVYTVVHGHTLFVQYYSPDGSDAEHLPISTSLAKTASARL
jgi:hypothetical protein